MSKKVIAHAAGIDTPQPFRFLDLPKEIRLCVYDHLEITTSRHTIPLKDGHSLDILNHTIPGIRILATNRQINDEASAILRKKVKILTEEPPLAIIKEEHLDAFHQTRVCIRRQPDLLDRIVASTARWNKNLEIKSIHDYRKGKMNLKYLKAFLALGNLVNTNESYESIQHIATFILRCVHYISSSPYQGEFLHPPMIIGIEMSSSSDTTVQTMVPVSLGIRLLINPWTALTTQPRYIPTPVTLTNKIHLLALRRIIASQQYQSMSTKVGLLYIGARADGRKVPDAAIDIVSTGIGRALQMNASRVGYIQYGGVFTFGEEV